MAKVARPCDATDCDRPILARGLCRMHYQRAQNGDTSVRLRPVAPRVNAGKTCSIARCGKPARKVTWCHMHYQRFKQHGDPLHEKQPPPSDCRKCGARKIRNGSGKFYCQPCARTANKAWREADPKLERERSRQSYQRHREARLEHGRAYYRANREAAAATNEAWRRRNPDLVRKYAREWAARNRERCLANVEKRRARQLAAICEHGPACVPWNVYQQIKFQLCVYCAAQAAHADHYMPLAKGGLHCIQNIVPSCERCNRSKGARMPDEWAEFLRKREAS